MSDWWTEDKRGTLLGFGVRRGTKLAHLSKILDGGPAAYDLSVFCGGMKPVIWVHSGLNLEDQAECEEWKSEAVAIEPGLGLEGTSVESLRNLCPHCKELHQTYLAGLPVPADAG